MSDFISNYGRLTPSASFSRTALDKTDKKSESSVTSVLASDAAPLMAAPSAPQGDVLKLSDVNQRLKNEPDFDRTKVDAIKQAIKQGQYPLNPKRIAESFMAIEQMIRD